MAKYSEIMKARAQAAPRCLLRREQAAERVGAPHLFALMEKYKWIKPCLQRHRMTLFDSRDIDLCIERIAQGEFPAATPEGVALLSSMSGSEGAR